jgi:hypothetical protein
LSRFTIALLALSLSLHPAQVLAQEGEDLDGDGFDAHDDCDDTDPTVYPGAAEGCDGIDNDCDGTPAPLEVDLDDDGFRLCDGFECDDTRAEVHAGAEELCDGLDTDCDGAVPADEVDEDGDGWRLCSGDCDDGEPAIHPSAAEICDGLDNDCSGAVLDTEIDVDGDGVAPCAGDGDDDGRGTRPGALEQCDGLDNNCDGLIDEDCTILGDDTPPVGAGGCTDRGCGWSISSKQSALLVFALPGFGWRRRGRARSPT